jgi:hypothetical protein
MQNLNHRVIKVKFLPVTNHKGARISLTESRYQKTDRKIIGYDYETGNTLESAVKYLKLIGVNVVGYGSFEDSYFIFSDSWADGKGFINIKGDLEL